MSFAGSFADQPKQQSIARLEAVLQKVVRSMEGTYERAAKLQHLHPTDFHCIGFLLGLGRAASPKDIIAHLSLTSGAGTALLDRLEARGYIRREPNPADRRGVLISLDEGGARQVIAKYSAIEAKFQAAIEPLSQHDLDVIAGFLDEIAGLAVLAATTQIDHDAA